MGLLPCMAYMGTCHWTEYGFWPLCPKQGMFSMIKMAYTVLSNPRSETFAGLKNTLKLCKTKKCVFCHLS